MHDREADGHKVHCRARFQFALARPVPPKKPINPPPGKKMTSYNVIICYVMIKIYVIESAIKILLIIGRIRLAL